MTAALLIGGAAMILVLAGWRLRRAAQKMRRILAEELDPDAEPLTEEEGRVRTANGDDPPKPANGPG